MKRFSMATLRKASAHRPAGYVDRVLAVATVDGDSVTVSDEDYAALGQWCAGHQCLAGTALAKLLSRFGIKADEKGCKCKSHAARMDKAGCDWCEANVDTIVGWLRDEASKRGLPFLDAAGRLLVRRAIANARRAAAS